MNHSHSSRWTRAFRNRLAKRHQLRLRLEQLESRYLLAADIPSPAPITWFESYDDVPRVS
ncbi:LEPR-XLL domain-containing protein [Stieleria sp. ICT_E10.1]|uniref:Planctomycete extracellular domain-containing protein n=1 Tax=Stieleria neptunia TaxID=2527979 RepID=A0A518HNB7_9BACT|nr:MULTISPECIES: LEPR-XLL domain-containing protein [Stieleria]MCS7468930.1 LEPR-XLL domain-containing protein [Stieleria sedimenti]QDV42331.1 hypothetical protein Enr13x_21760 [Stieleria neptunia]